MSPNWPFQSNENNDSSSKYTNEELDSNYYTKFPFLFGDCKEDNSSNGSFNYERDNSHFSQDLKFNNDDDNILENLKKNKDFYNYENIGNSVTNCVSNKNLGQKNGIEKSEKNKDSESNVNNVNKNKGNVKNKKKNFTIVKKKKIKFKVIKTRAKRKNKNGIVQTKLRLFNIELKFKGIVIDSTINYINKKLQRFKFKTLKYSIKKKPYEKLKNSKLKDIMSCVSTRYGKESNNNKSIINKIYRQKEYSQIKEILELTFFDVFYHILIEETNVLAGLRQEYRNIYTDEILNKKAQNYIQGFGNVLVQYKNYLNN